MKGVFDTKPQSEYDDEITSRYHFPSQYFSVAQSLVGDWIVYREPQRNRGRRAYISAARVLRIETDSARSNHFYARVTDYLAFDRPVPLLTEGFYAEAPLRTIGDRSRVGAYLQGKSIRLLSDHDFATIVSAGLSDTLNRSNMHKLNLDPGQMDVDTRVLLDAPESEKMRRIEQILLNRKIRDANFRHHVCAAYAETCAVTGLRILNGGGKAEVQAAHIWPVAEGGPDVVQNGLALCGTAHWLFDRHLIAITEDYRLLISHNSVPVDARTLFEKHLERIHLPKDNRHWPHPGYLSRHRSRFV